MRRWSRARLGSLTVTAALALVGTTAVAAAAPPGAYDRPGVNELVSVASTGTQAKHLPPPVTANDCGMPADISANGRYVVFLSDADNLVPERPTMPGRCDAYLRDRVVGKTSRISVASDGSQAVVRPDLRHVAVSSPSISADGRYVAFWSAAMNFDTKRSGGIFVHDTRTGRTTRAIPADVDADLATISGDGRFLAFVSRSKIAGNTSGKNQVFLTEWRRHTYRLVSRSLDGRAGNGESTDPSISADGRFVAFESLATDLVQGNTLQELCQCPAADVYWRDMKTGRTVRVSVASDGAQAQYNGVPSCVVSTRPLATLPEPLGPLLGGERFNLCYSDLSSGGNLISADGRYVTFASNATNLVPNDSSGNVDAFVHDITTRRTERVSVDEYGGQLPYGKSVAISADGRQVAYVAGVFDRAACQLDFVSRTVSDVAAGVLGLDPCQRFDANAHDRVTGERDVLSRSVTGVRPKPGPCTSSEQVVGRWGAHSAPKALSADGRFASFTSSGKDLVAGDRNNHCDYFVRDRGKRLGVGGFGGSGTRSDGGPSETCATDAVCLPPLSTVDSGRDVRAEGGDLIGARVVPRPGFGDLFVKLDLARMPQVAGAPAGGLLYGLAFAAGGSRYEVRVQRVPGADFDPKGGASFGLFRQDRITGVYTKVAALKGGYGTTGPSVVFAVPLKELGAVNGGRLSDVRAFTGIGSYLSGAVKSLDMLRLQR